MGLATTESVAAVPAHAGTISTSVGELVNEAARLVGDLEEAVRLGKAARNHALDRYGIDRFLLDWDRVLERVGS